MHRELAEVQLHLTSVEMITQQTLAIHIAGFTEQPFLLHVCHRNTALSLALTIYVNSTSDVKFYIQNTA